MKFQKFVKKYGKRLAVFGILVYYPIFYLVVSQGFFYKIPELLVSLIIIVFVLFWFVSISYLLYVVRLKRVFKAVIILYLVITIVIVNKVVNFSGLCETDDNCSSSEWQLLMNGQSSFLEFITGVLVVTPIAPLAVPIVGIIVPLL